MHFSKVSPALRPEAQELTMPRKGIYWSHTYRLKIGLLDKKRLKHSNEIISAMIFQLTGLVRNRKQVSSHVQYLKGLARDVAKTSPKSVRPKNGTRDPQQLSHLYVTDTDAFRKHGSDSLLDFSPMNQCSDLVPFAFQSTSSESPTSVLFSIQDVPNDARDVPIQSPIELRIRVNGQILSLATVCRRFRAEVLQNIPSVTLHPFNGVNDLLSLCTLSDIDPRIRIKTINATIMGGIDTKSSASQDSYGSTDIGTVISDRLPNLRTLNVTLVPLFLDPRQHTEVEINDAFTWIYGNGAVLNSRTWGRRTHNFLASLSKIKATVRVTLNWQIYCDYFEREYVSKGEWVFVDQKESEESRP